MNDDYDRMIRTEDNEKMVEEYSVSGWIRWVPDIVIKETTGFLVFNVR